MLATNNADRYNEQRRLLRNNLAQRQTNINLVGELTSYEISKPGNCFYGDTSNREVPSASETINPYYFNYDIDFNLILPEDCTESTEAEDVNDDEPDDNLVLSNELFSSIDESNSLALHPYTSITISEFCTSLVRTFLQANLRKSYSSSILELIHLALPKPNILPTSIDVLMKYLQGIFSIFLIQNKFD